MDASLEVGGKHTTAEARGQRRGMVLNFDLERRATRRAWGGIAANQGHPHEHDHKVYVTVSARIRPPVSLGQVQKWTVVAGCVARTASTPRVLYRVRPSGSTATQIGRRASVSLHRVEATARGPCEDDSTSR